MTELTGLRLDPYFSGTKLVWLAENEPNTWALVESGRYAIGTVDSYLIARMTRGTWHVTDVSNACRTLLFDLERGRLVRRAVRPSSASRATRSPSWSRTGATSRPPTRRRSSTSSSPSPESPATSRPRCSGRPASTRATRSAPTAQAPSSSPTPAATVVRSDAGLLSTAAWRTPDDELVYATEGAIFVTGAAVQWLRDGLQIVGSAAETEAIAATVDDTEGVVFVPALTGLGAPHWDPHARGTILGITRGTTRGHIVRATLEAIAFEVRDVIEADGPRPLRVVAARRRRRRRRTTCSARSRPTSSGCRSSAREIVETTALGAAFIAGLGTGVWSSYDDLRDTWSLDRRFEPAAGDRGDADARWEKWKDAVERSKDWAD